MKEVAPRSYQIQTDKGVYRRNRRDLKEIHLSDHEVREENHREQEVILSEATEKMEVPDSRNICIDKSSSPVTEQRLVPLQQSPRVQRNRRPPKRLIEEY